MDNIDYALSVFSKSPIPYQAIYKKDDNLSEIFSLFAMSTIDDENIEGFLKIIQHERFTTSCQTQLFQSFFNYDPKNEHVFENFFRFLLEIDYFDFSLIFKDVNSDTIYFNNNFQLFPIMIQNLRDKGLYYPAVNDYYLLKRTRLIQYFPELKEYLSISKRYSIKDFIFYSMRNSISITCGDLEGAYKHTKEKFNSNQDRSRYIYDEEDDGTNPEDVYQQSYFTDIEMTDLVFNELFKLKEFDFSYSVNHNLFSFIAFSMGMFKLGAIAEDYKINKNITSFKNLKCNINYSFFNNNIVNLSFCLDEFDRLNCLSLNNQQKEKIINIIKNIRKIIEK